MFITIDGPDGTGKTTLAKRLESSLRENGNPAIYTSEPTNSPKGKHIRQILRNGGEELQRLTELFVEDRADHIRDFIFPQSIQGKVVICDRYKYSTVCYQHLQGEPIDRLIELNKKFISPDIAFILLADDPAVLMDRIGERGNARDLFETQEILKKSISLYSKMNVFYPEDHIIFVNAQKSPGELIIEIQGYIIDWMDSQNSAPPDLIFDQRCIAAMA